MTRNTKKSDFLNSIQSNTKKRNIAEYVIIFLAITIVFILCKALGIKNDNDKTQILMIASLFGLMCDACYLGMKKQLTTTKIIQLIIFAGIIMRVGYTIYTHMFVRGKIWASSQLIYMKMAVDIWGTFIILSKTENCRMETHINYITLRCIIFYRR